MFQELLNIAKKRPRKDSARSSGNVSSDSSADDRKAVNGTSPANNTQTRPGSDSDTSDSDSDWGASNNKKKKKVSDITDIFFMSCLLH